METDATRFAAVFAAILTLEARYAVCWDRGESTAWADVFTPDGVFEIEAVGDRERVLIRGRAALAEFCARFTADFSGVHLPALPLVDVSGDTASAVVNFHFTAVARLGATHTVTRTASGHYEVQYARTRSGWRITHRLEKPLASSRSEHFDS